MTLALDGHSPRWQVSTAGRLLLCAMLATPLLLIGTPVNAQGVASSATPEITISLISLESLRLAPVVMPDGSPLGQVEDVLSDANGQIHRLLIHPEDKQMAASIDFARFTREAVSDPTQAQAPGDIRYRLVLDMTPEQLTARADQPLSSRLSRQLERSMGEVENGLDSFRDQAADVLRSLGKQLEGESDK
ncbi:MULTISPECIES: hypothetical protein [Cobetia]|uniref:PRC-barrel domain-containing protein n=1 Tax=Cobetia crustatorum TaxID=553385 RepID=A0A558HUC6_9GAMM|nr:MULTISPECIES: hypothetical protein [Cobetia]TVU72688.1 hypothetical protein FQP86_03160 [Cobetia crustatorum]